VATALEPDDVVALLDVADEADDVEFVDELVEFSEDGVVVAVAPDVVAVVLVPVPVVVAVEATVDVELGAMARTRAPAAPTAATPPTTVAVTTRRRARSRLSVVARDSPLLFMS
jgi:hypothetical protein